VGTGPAQIASGGIAQTTVADGLGCHKGIKIFNQLLE
jgi:hypothetical protein